MLSSYFLEFQDYLITPLQVRLPNFTIHGGFIRNFTSEIVPFNGSELQMYKIDFLPDGLHDFRVPLLEGEREEYPSGGFKVEVFWRLSSDVEDETRRFLRRQSRVVCFPFPIESNDSLLIITWKLKAASKAIFSFFREPHCSCSLFKTYS
ncbi:hypothetical protein ABFS83_13G049100 [Erythranthe nasuta]